MKKLVSIIDAIPILASLIASPLYAQTMLQPWTNMETIEGEYTPHCAISGEESAIITNTERYEQDRIEAIGNSLIHAEELSIDEVLGSTPYPVTDMPTEYRETEKMFNPHDLEHKTEKAIEPSQEFLDKTKRRIQCRCEWISEFRRRDTITIEEAIGDYWKIAQQYNVTIDVCPGCGIYLKCRNVDGKIDIKYTVCTECEWKVLQGIKDEKVPCKPKDIDGMRVMDEVPYA